VDAHACDDLPGDHLDDDPAELAAPQVEVVRPLDRHAGPMDGEAVQPLVEGLGDADAERQRQPRERLAPEACRLVAAARRRRPRGAAPAAAPRLGRGPQAEPRDVLPGASALAQQVLGRGHAAEADHAEAVRPRGHAPQSAATAALASGPGTAAGSSPRLTLNTRLTPRSVVMPHRASATSNVAFWCVMRMNCVPCRARRARKVPKRRMFASSSGASTSSSTATGRPEPPSPMRANRNA